MPHPLIRSFHHGPRVLTESLLLFPFYTPGYGGLKKLRLDILHDFFRSAFDGSGAENFYDAGSCIDGRLTSAWNWCSQLSSKPYFPIFKLAGFNGFDGAPSSLLSSFLVLPGCVGWLV